MKKILAIVLAIAMIFCFAGCGKTEEPAAVGLPNPMVEYSSLQEIDAEAEVGLMPIGNASDEKFYVINGETAEYDFTIDGIEYSYRANNGTYEDISGLYGANGAVFTNFHPGNDEPSYVVATDEFKTARWFSMAQIQYVLTAKDGGKLSAEDFNALVESCQADTGLMISSEFYDSLAGEYADKVSQRAVMEVESIGYEGLIIKIWWGNSATETEYWEMDVAITESDGLLTYNDGLHQRITFPEDGSEEQYETIGENMSGYFSYNAETDEIDWSGAPEESCQSCIFVPTAETADGSMPEMIVLSLDNAQ